MRQGDSGELQVRVCVPGLDRQNLKKCALRLILIALREIMIAEIVPQARGMRRETQRALVEWLCLLVFLLRVQNKAQEPQQVGPIRLDSDGAAQVLLGLIESSLLECGRGLGIKVARFGLGQRSRAGRA